MREILFRGKAIRSCRDTSYDGFIFEWNKGKWVYGNLVLEKSPCGCVGKCYILNPEEPFNRIEVDPETVGQYTGMRDIDGDMIFEGNLYKSYTGHIFEVVYLEEEACFVGVCLEYPNKWDFLEDVAIMTWVGNRWDNHELLEVEE